MLAYLISIFRGRRVGRWARRTAWVLSQMKRDFGLGGPTKPVWLRDNPFLLKISRAEARRPGLALRMGVTVALLGGLLLWGMSLQVSRSSVLGFFLGFLFRMTLPAALFATTAFVHVLLIISARTAGSVVLADEARRVTLPDLLLTPLRRAEMLLAMGVGPARAAFLVALSGLPVYLLLGQFGGLTGWQTVCLYILFALVCYQPPTYAVPALSGLGQTPDAEPGQSAAAVNKQAARRMSFVGAGFPLVFGLQFLGQVLGAAGGAWLGHLFKALHLPILSGLTFLIFFTWPYYATRLLSSSLPFFHLSLSPLVYVLPLALMTWAGSALRSASALSAGSASEMLRLPLWSRAQTLTRWTVRVTGFCVLAVVWQAWVDTGDTANLAELFAAGPGWSAAGLLTLLGGVSLPGVYSRALAVDPLIQGTPELRPVGLTLRRALKRGVRPLGVALGMFLLVCVCGGLSPFAPPVYLVISKIAAAGISTIVWTVGVRRAVPKIGPWISGALLYGVPLGALAVPGGSVFAAFSPVSAWVRLFAGGPALLSRIPVLNLGVLPSFEVCAAGPFVIGLVLISVFGRQKQSVKVTVTTAAMPAKRVPARNERQTAALMAWVTARTDNPLFTYEMRTRTRSGRWFNWLVLAPFGFAGLVVVAVVYPWFIEGFADITPFRFFGNQSSSNSLLALASVLLTVQCLVLGLRGQIITERLIVKDREQGTLGFLLISPLSMRQIFWGKVFGQTAAAGAVWAGAGLACFILYGVSTPLVGIVPALGAWASGQFFVAALFVLGIALGSSLTSFPVMQKTLKGLSTLIFALFLGASGFAGYVLFGDPNDWRTWTMLLGGDSLFMLTLAAGLFGIAGWRLSVLRGRDVTAGDGTG